MSALDSTPIKFRWYFSVAAALFVFVVVGVYSTRMAYDTDATDGYDQQQGALRKAKLDKMQATDHTTLTTADWIDPTKGTVRIPIDEAMPEEVAALKAQPAAIGSAIAGAAPAATPATATNATNAPTSATNAAPSANPPPTK